MKVDYHGLEVDSSTVPRGIRRDLETLSLRTSTCTEPITTRKTVAMATPKPDPDKFDQIMKLLGLTSDASLGTMIDALEALIPSDAPSDAPTAEQTKALRLRREADARVAHFHAARGTTPAKTAADPDEVTSRLHRISVREARMCREAGFSPATYAAKKLEIRGQARGAK